MNVMVVVPWDQERGGVATVVNKLAKHLSERDHNVRFFHPAESERPQDKVTRAGFVGTEMNLRTPHIPERPIRGTVAFLVYLPIALFRLAVEIRRHRIDVVNVHYPLSAFCHFALCRRFLGFRLVVSVHGADLMPGGDHPARQPWGVRMLLRAADRITAPSASYLADVSRRIPEIGEKGAVVHNGIDIEELVEDGQAHQVTGRGPILCIAAHNTKKGLDTLLRAYAEARGRGLGHELVLAGDGPLRGELEALAVHLGVTEGVRFVGFQSLPEIRRLLVECAYLVLPSRSEPFGIVLLEAMAFDKAVLATAVGGIPEFVSHLQNGLLVPPDDVVALADGLCRLAEDDSLRARLGRNGGSAVRAGFTSEQMAIRYLDVLVGESTPTAGERNGFGWEAERDAEIAEAEARR